MGPGDYGRKVSRIGIPSAQHPRKGPSPQRASDDNCHESVKEAASIPRRSSQADSKIQPIFTTVSRTRPGNDV